MERRWNINGITTAAAMLGSTPESCAGTKAFSAQAFTQGCHELIPQNPNDQIVCSALAAVVLLGILSDASMALWVTNARYEKRYGRLSGRGMMALGLDPSRVVIAQANRSTDALWAAEEAARSGAVTAVVAETDRADFTMTRRLTLASERHGTPIILLLPSGHAGPSAVRSRWRLRRRLSVPDSYDPSAPGRPSWRLHLEHCKRFFYPFGYQTEIAYDHETYCFDSLAQLGTGPVVSEFRRTGS